jgi:glutathione S-transferase
MKSSEEEAATMMKLYQAEWCPYCARVRAHMTDLGITYINVNVPRSKDQRTELVAIAGKPGIPTLVDGDLIIADDDDAIIEYLDRKYAKATA